MSVDIFATFEPSQGVPTITVGETDTDPRSKGIPIRTFSYGFKNTPTQAGPGKAQFQPVILTRRVDAASPRLFRALCMGGFYTLVTFEFFMSGNVKMYTIGCKLALLTEIQQIVEDGSGVVIEHITMQCGALQLRYRTRKADGTFDTEVVEQWSTIKNNATFDVV